MAVIVDVVVDVVVDVTWSLTWTATAHDSPQVRTDADVPR
jgi:hypothetical protein